MEFMQNNWQIVVIVFFIIEKIIRISPTKSDDIIFDMILKPLFEKFKPKK
jgi:hypothetical protein